MGTPSGGVEMIIDAIVGWLCALAIWFAGLFPTISVPDSALGEVSQWTGSVGMMLDVGAMSAAMVWIIGCETLLFGLRLLMLARNQILIWH